MTNSNKKILRYWPKNADIIPMSEAYNKSVGYEAICVSKIKFKVMGKYFIIKKTLTIYE